MTTAASGANQTTTKQTARRGSVANQSPLKTPVVDAIYTPSSNPLYAGNPYIEALGVLRTKKQLAANIEVLPHYSEDVRELPDAMRFRRVKVLSRVFKPFTAQVEVAYSLIELMLEGYMHRNPSKDALRTKMVRNYQKLHDPAFVGAYEDDERVCEALTFFGLSGMGKTRTIKRLLSPFPPGIWHKLFRGHQIPYIYVETPQDGTILSMLFAIHKALDKILGEDKASSLPKSSATVNVKVEHYIHELNARAESVGLGLIIIDELQHAGMPKNGELERKFMNFLVRLVNMSVAPIALMGTLASYKLFSDEFRAARRSTMRPLMNYKNSKEFKELLKIIWRYQYLRNPVELTDDLVDVIYERTQGVMDLVIKLYLLVQRRAIELKKGEDITPKLLNQIADEYFQPVQLALNAMKYGNVNVMKEFEDLYIAGLKEVHDRYNKALGNKKQEQAHEKEGALTA